MRAVHRLQREPVAGAVKVGVSHQVFNALQHFLQQGTLDQSGLKHRVCVCTGRGAYRRAFEYAGDEGRRTSIQIFEIVVFRWRRRSARFFFFFFRPRPTPTSLIRQSMNAHYSAALLRTLGVDTMEDAMEADAGESGGAEVRD